MSALKQETEKVCTFTYSGGFVNACPSWYSLLGYSQAELASMKLEDIIAEGSGAKILQALKIASLKDGSSGEASERLEVVACGGYKIRGLLSMEWIKGKEIMFYGVFRYSKENSSVENNMVYECLSENSISGVFKYDEYSNIIASDKVFENYFGLKDASGEKTYSFSGNAEFASFLREAADADDCLCVEVGGEKMIAVIDKSSGVVSARIYNKNFLMNSSPHEDLSSILNKKRIWDNFPVMFLIDTQSKIIVDASRAASEFYGYSIEEFKNMPVSNLSMLPADISEQEFALALSGKKTFFISRHRMAGGQVKDISYTTAVIAVGMKKYLITFITDITRRKNLEKVIEEKNAALTELNLNLSRMVQDAQKESKKKEEMFLRQSKLATIGEMVSSISDSWKEPLNAIALSIQDMEDAKKYGELDETYIENMVKTIMGNLGDISSSIDTCMNFFKHENQEELFDSRCVLQSVIKVLGRRFAENGITVCSDCACMTESCIGFDSKRGCLGGFTDILGQINEFKHAVCNILINSVDAISSARKSGILMVEDEGLIFINIKTDGKIIAISFSDNGGGLDEKLSGKVFEPYFSTKEDGMGIGLYVTKQLVEKNLKGSISFENDREGAMVTIKLPCAQNIVINA